MEVQEILSGKKKLIEYLKEKGFQKEKEYSDDEYKEGSYFKIDKRKLLVVYEVFEEEKIKEIKDHFLIDRGLSYCVIILDDKLIFLRNFGETKHFIYSERTKNNPSKVDKLKNITALDSLFQSKDISALFYEAFKIKRNLLVQNIKNDVEPVQKYLIAQKIFDRFFFIYFLCHKGIIKFKDGGKISGETLFTKILLKKGKFLENLKKLFHLFNSQEKNLLEIGDYRIVIPYLNGGLFRPDVLEQDLDIKLKDEQWEEIFEFLNSYHWIIEDVRATEENEEKILTPEILGHVYERSVVEWESEGFEKEAENAVKKITERKKKGVYYTPESITDYISNNTIISYLLDKLGNKYASLDELIESKNKKDMKDAVKILDEIKVLDPACGSGAFLIKASEVIFGLKRRLQYEIKEKKNFYDLKLDIITENIYGVDILAGAIEISKLRLWLWLISDFEESKNEIKALPNIEYNLKVGNSLVGWLDEKLIQMPMNTPLTEKVDGIFTGLIAFSENGDGEYLKKARELLRAYKLTDYIEAYYILYKIYRRTHGLKAENLRSILETIRKSIYATVTPAFLDYVNKKIKPNYDNKNPPITQEELSELQVFHWRIDFGHIILNGGFDVVIGNPPYFSITSCKDYEKKIIFNTNEKFLDGEYVGKIDIYSFFINKCMRGILNDKRYFGFIIPKTILSNVSFSVLRKIILEEYKICELVDLEKVFSEVTGTMTYLLLFMKKEKITSNYSLSLNSMDLSGEVISSVIKVNMLKRPPFFIWVLSKRKLELLNKIEAGSVQLCQDFITKNGVCTGKNSKYVSKDKPNSNWKPIYVAKDISQYHIKRSTHFVLYDRDLLHRPREEWIFSKPKILTQMIRGLNTEYRLISAIDETDILALNNINIIRQKEKNSNLLALEGFLNSKLLNYWFKNSITDVNIKTVYLDILPLKIKTKHLSDVEKYVHKLMEDSKNMRIRQDLDELMYKIYDLNQEDIELINSEFTSNKIDDDDDS